MICLRLAWCRARSKSPLLYHLTAASCDVLGPFLLLPWSCGAFASVLGRCGGVLSLAVVDSGAVVVDWAFVWCAWCRLVVVAVCELQKSARARAEGLEGGWSPDS